MIPCDYLKKGLIVKQKLSVLLFTTIFVVMRAEIQKKASPGTITPGFETAIQERAKKVPFISKVGLFFGIKVPPKLPWLDISGKGYWTIKNKTNHFIEVNSNVHKKVIIEPGKTGRVYRSDNWDIQVKLEKYLSHARAGTSKTKLYKDKVNTLQGREHIIDVRFVYKQWRPKRIQKLELIPVK